MNIVILDNLKIVVILFIFLLASWLWRLLWRPVLCNRQHIISGVAQVLTCPGVNDSLALDSFGKNWPVCVNHVPSEDRLPENVLLHAPQLVSLMRTRISFCVYVHLDSTRLFLPLISAALFWLKGRVSAITGTSDVISNVSRMQHRHQQHQLLVLLICRKIYLPFHLF